MLACINGSKKKKEDYSPFIGEFCKNLNDSQVLLMILNTGGSIRTPTHSVLYIKQLLDDLPAMTAITAMETCEFTVRNISVISDIFASAFRTAVKSVAASRYILD